MTKKPLWSPKSSENLLNKFVKYLKNNKSNFNDYNELHEWSIKNKNKFWSKIWNFTSIIGELNEPIIENEKNFFKSNFFKNSKLNFTQNLIQFNNNSDAIIFYSEKGHKRKISWKELDNQVSKISFYFKEKKIKKGDRIAAILPNIPETVIGFLGTAKIGAIWSSCSADFGPKAVIDRFKQIEPKILIISDYYYYNNKKINILEKIHEIKQELPSIKNIIIAPYSNKVENYNVEFKYDNWIEIMENKSIYKNYEIFDFNIPLYILYSSGTTGKPKCIVHGAGGSLIQHKKEHMLHCNINPKDKVFYYTSCGWMMWNWLVSCLASKATIVLYDGSPFIPKKEHLFDIVDKENISFFGVGAKYLDTLRQKKINIKNKYSLKKLKTIASTGSPLVHETFEYTYKYIKKNLHLASISGGTDIVSCFVLGNPNLKVYSGEIQCKGLGMDIAVFNEKGNEINQSKGELVCKTTFPSKPLFFWKDKDNKKYISTYFNKYKNVWHHGDFAELTNNQGFIIYGRSDATLNAGGVRIGTAELYRVVENIEEINESIAVEHKYNNDTRVILFIKLNKKFKFNKLLNKKIKEIIKNSLSPKHVPALIFDINDIPRTKSGKIVELLVKKIINGEKIDNLSVLSNPESLKEYEKKSKFINL